MFRVKQCSSLTIPKISQVVMLFMGAFGLVSVQNFIRSGMNPSNKDERPPTLGTNLVLGPPKNFFRRNPSGTLRDVHWDHLGDPKKVPGAPSQGFLIFLGFDENITKIEIWL